MSPKEKKEEIIQIFIGCQEVKTQGKEVIRLIPPDLKLAKRSAIKCVEQIIEAAKKIDSDLYEYHGQQMFPEIYWQEVLEYIKNS